MVSTTKAHGESGVLGHQSFHVYFLHERHFCGKACTTRSPCMRSDEIVTQRTAGSHFSVRTPHLHAPPPCVLETRPLGSTRQDIGAARPCDTAKLCQHYDRVRRLPPRSSSGGRHGGRRWWWEERPRERRRAPLSSVWTASDGHAWGVPPMRRSGFPVLSGIEFKRVFLVRVSSRRVGSRL